MRVNAALDSRGVWLIENPAVASGYAALALAAGMLGGCSEDTNGLGYCVVTTESTELREGDASPGELVQADSGYLADEVLICGSYNSPRSVRLGRLREWRRRTIVGVTSLA